MTSTRKNPNSRAWEQFKDATTEHTLTVLQDSGVFRHMRMAEPGTNIWSWAITTWPEHLAITGDIGSGYIFSRTDDMFEFFRVHAGIEYSDASPAINPGYWGEKTQRIVDTKMFADDMFLQRVREYLDETDMEDAAKTALLEEAEDYSGNEQSAREWLRDTKPFNNTSMYWDASFDDYDHHFLLACYAIVATIAAYDARNKETA